MMTPPLNTIDLKEVADTIKRRIDMQIESDQASQYRQNLERWLPLMSDAYRPSDDKPFRTHCGASLIGNPCDRQIWYGFNWTQQNLFDSRLLRLFNTGHLQEAHFIAMLECGGIEVYQADPDTGKQYKFSHSNGHAGGSLDGILRNVPELEDFIVTAEFKTSSDKLFKKLVKDGVEVAKPTHYAQMQVGMVKFDAQYCVYMAINKDNSDYYVEIVKANQYIGNHFLDRFDAIVFNPNPPVRISDNPTVFDCKFCDYALLCHEGVGDKIDTNCRTCKYSKPSQDESLAGEWQCVKFNVVIPKDKALNGCGKWEVRVL